MAKNDDICDKSNCSHFIKESNLKFYRYKYIMAVAFGIACIVGWFWYANYRYDKSINDIIDAHASLYADIENNHLTPANKKDSIKNLVYQELRIEVRNISDTTSKLIELQYNKIQSEYTVLQLWAAALMIVFLVFSIYSMFKVDEMQKQGRDTLERLEGFSTKAKKISDDIDKLSKKQLEELEKKSEEELKTIQEKSNEEIKRLKTELDNTQTKFNQDVNSKTTEFESAVTGYKDELKKSTESNNNLIKNLITVIQNSSSTSKDTAEQKDDGTTDNSELQSTTDKK